MGAVVKLVTGTVIGAGIYTAYSYIRNINRAKAELQTIPKIYIWKLDLSGLTIRIDALLKNPSGGSFYVKFPFVKVYHKDTLIGTSQVIDKNIKIPAYGQVVIDSIMVNIPVLSFFTLAYDIVKELNKKNPVAFTVETITTIDLGIVKIPYSSKSESTLKL